MAYRINNRTLYTRNDINICDIHFSIGVPNARAVGRHCTTLCTPPNRAIHSCDLRCPYSLMLWEKTSQRRTRASAAEATHARIMALSRPVRSTPRVHRRAVRNSVMLLN